MKTLKFLEGKYRGRRIFVMGSGKSLKEMPLHLLQNEYTFGINRIGLTYRPSFYWLATTNAHNVEYRFNVDAAIESAYHSFIATFLKGTIPDAENVYWIQVAHISGANPTNPGEVGVEDWVKQNIAGCQLSGYGHSGFAVIRLAAYMGFNPIYVIGMDGKYEYHQLGQSDPNHFDDNYESDSVARHPSIIDDINLRIRDSHTIMSAGASLLGVDIINAGRKGRIKQYPWVKFEELFECKN